MDNATATYTKLKDGSWGVRSTRSLAAGSTVVVAKRDGTLKVETVARVVWTGNGVWLCSLCASSASPAPRRQSGARTGCSCGSREDASGVLIDSPRNCSRCEHDA